MQKELDGITTKHSIQILGVNEAGQEVGNAGIIEGRKLPWLQDTTAENVWGTWGVTWRDVVILDPQNYRVAVYNLTVHNLGDPTNYAALESMLIDAANAP
jgi:hypothetical protein